MSLGDKNGQRGLDNVCPSDFCKCGFKENPTILSASSTVLQASQACKIYYFILDPLQEVAHCRADTHGAFMCQAQG